MGAASQKRTPDTQLFRDVFNASPIGIAVENLEGQPLFVNPAFCPMPGFSKEELTSKHCVQFSPPEDTEKHWTLFQQGPAGSIDHYQLEVIFDGTARWCGVEYLFIEQSFPLEMTMVDDITDNKTAEEAVQQANLVLEERTALPGGDSMRDCRVSF